jgi:dienelactone hydrolase
MTRFIHFGLDSLLLCALSVFAVEKAKADAAVTNRPDHEKGVVTFRPQGDQQNIPERYRLEEHSFPYEMKRKTTFPNIGVDVFRVRFPSPVTSPTPENNTVHAEYYCPQVKGPFPCVIVLDITGGDQTLSRLISTNLAQNKIGALFVQMAYYGPRRPPGSRLRFMSPNVNRTIEAVRQTVLDLRRATAWMEARPEVDPKRLGILGTSLGSFMSALTGEMEPKLGRVVVLLGGGGFVDAYYDNPQGAGLRKVWEAVGGTKQKLADIIAPVDPITCAANLRDHKLLIIAGSRDEIVPPSATTALWKASGEQKIVWYDCTHYGAALYYVPAMTHIIQHLGAK